MPSLLFLTQRIPYPPFKGEKIRAWQILRHLARSYQVHLGCLVDDPHDLQHVPAVRALCADAHFATLDRRRAKLACLSGLLTGEPLSVTFYRDRGLAGWVDRVLTDIRPDVVFVSSSNMAPYVLDRGDPAALRVVDLVDVDSEKWRAYAEAGSGPMRWVHAREARKTAALEARIVRDCDWSTFVSPEEAGLFTTLVPGSAGKVRAISNGVDSAHFDPALPFPPPFDPAGLNYVFTGTMDYTPNCDAVAWFARAILPTIRQTRGDARFHIVGSSPSTEVQALAGLPGVFVTGRVPDVRPYVAHATAAVAPMRIARGIQNKVLEAMAMARPVVVTRDALDGIAAVPGQEVLLADGAAPFAAACLSAAAPEAAAIGAAARRRVLADYVWSERLRGFDALLAPHPRRGRLMQDFIDAYLAESLAALSAFQADSAARAAMADIAGAIAAALGQGRKLLVAGNGGSAADAQHIAGEIVGRLFYDRAPLPAIALTVDSSVLTAIANDYGYEHVFERQVLALGQPGDVLLGLSTSGTTPSILRAFAAGRARGLLTVGFTGSRGGPMREACDLLLEAPAAKTAVIQQIHIVAAHIVCGLVERALFPRP